MIWLKVVGGFLLAIFFAMVAAGLASRPGYIFFRWFGWEGETSVVAVMALLGVCFMLFLVLRLIFRLIKAIFGI